MTRERYYQGNMLDKEQAPKLTSFYDPDFEYLKNKGLDGIDIFSVNDKNPPNPTITYRWDFARY